MKEGCVEIVTRDKSVSQNVKLDEAVSAIEALIRKLYEDVYAKGGVNEL